MARLINKLTGKPFDGEVSIEEARLVMNDYESTDERIQEIIGYLYSLCTNVIDSEVDKYKQACSENKY